MLNPESDELILGISTSKCIHNPTSVFVDADPKSKYPRDPAMQGKLAIYKIKRPEVRGALAVCRSRHFLGKLVNRYDFADHVEVSVVDSSGRDRVVSSEVLGKDVYCLITNWE